MKFTVHQLLLLIFFSLVVDIFIGIGCFFFFLLLNVFPEKNIKLYIFFLSEKGAL